MRWLTRMLSRYEEPRPPAVPAPPPEPDADDAVPRGVRVAAAWSWRLLVIAAASVVAVWAIINLQVVVVPALVALLLAALVVPLVDWLTRSGVPRGISAGIGLVAMLVVLVGLLGLVGQQIVSGLENLTAQVLQGLEEVRVWLIRGPLNLSQSQIDSAFDQEVEQGREFVSTGGSQITAGALGVASTVGHVVAGFFLVLFATYFFLYDGKGIWRWLLGLFPRTARPRVDGAAHRAWRTLTSYVRATILVAFVDAVGIALVALIIGVPLWFPIGVLVFLGAFIPIVGALISGSVAVLVALVAVSPLSALVMAAGVLGVQQLESHILQPFLLGRLVRIHPLAVILAVAAGVYLAGIVGALFAVPVVAVANTVVVHLARRGEDSTQPSEEAPVRQAVAER